MAWIRRQQGSTGKVDARALVSHLTTASHSITIQRTGGQVELSFYVRQLDVAGVDQGGTVLTLPVGWRPAAPYRAPAVQPSTVVLDVSTSGKVTISTGSLAQGSYATFRLTHLTTDPMPTGGV